MIHSTHRIWVTTGVVFFAFLVFACHPGKRYIISEKKFIHVLVDLHLAEAIGNQLKNSDQVMLADSTSLYGLVFEKYHVTRAMFDSTMMYYSLRPDKFQKLYNEVTAQLKNLEEETTKAQEEEAKQLDEVLWQDDQVYQFPPLAGERIEIDVPIRGKGIYVVSATVKMLPDDSSLNPRMSVYFYAEPEGKELRFQEVSYTKRNGEPKTYRAVRRVDSDEYTRIRGYIVNYSNTDSTFKRNMVITDIKVAKRKEQQNNGIKE
jgi:hypothetical protein